MLYSILQFLFPKLLIRKPQSEFCLYITFDDGPTPEVTEWVLKTLKTVNIEATFFCLGKQIEAFPEIFEDIKNFGHSIGNHGYDHLNGWKTDKKTYLQNIEIGYQKTNSRLFRPPYGRINPLWIPRVLENHKLVFWSILSQDFNTNINPELTIQKILKKLKNGDIVVFHDSEKAFDNLKIMLPALIEWGEKRDVIWRKLYY